MNCDRIARWYRVLEYLVFGQALEKRRFEFLDEVADARQVLILGDGDGRFTAEFVKRNPETKVESVDLSAGMIDLARRRLGESAAQVRFRVGDARTISIDGQYDLVVTHFFLDCFTNEELDRLIERISQHCKPGARWVLSEFGLPEREFPKIAARAFIRFMYFCFFVTTGLTVTKLPDYVQAMTGRGFRLLHKRSAIGGLLVSEIWQITA